MFIDTDWSSEEKDGVEIDCEFRDIIPSLEVEVVIVVVDKVVMVVAVMIGGAVIDWVDTKGSEDVRAVEALILLAT